MKTWQFEMAFVAVVLAAVVFLTEQWHNLTEWIGAAAVMLTFGHTQVADRLAESAEKAADRGIDQENTIACSRWGVRYLVGKELLWTFYFVLHQSWSALVGVIVFLFYPAWRTWWRG